ncbi:MAG: sulfate reduction electron transfer complex DsrMKJOP subunit DsrK, partial [candidate division NC10 bacterium]
MAEQVPKPEELARVDYRPPAKDWRDPAVEFRKGVFCYSAAPKHLEYLGLPNPRRWHPSDADWKLPADWKRIILEGMKERLDRFRSFRLFMDICVRCGACADKCHFYIGSGDPKNMPVMRAELMRSVYRRYFTPAGRILGPLAGGRELTEDVIKEWFYYFYQCTECRRCSVFCPFGIDTAEVTMMGRELLNLVGCNINWILEPVANCQRTGNHLGIQPHAFKDAIDFLVDELAEITGIRVEAPINRKGAEILYVIPSAETFGTPHYYTLLGTLLLFHAIGLDYTLSAYASEGGNFGLFTSHEMMKRLNAKIYAEARRLGVKWILGGECGHMWRVVHQYMDTMNGPADFLEEPVSPVTGTRFPHARSTKMVHICEFTADLIHHGRLRLDPRRNDHWVATFHDSCNPARSMGLIEEPRVILRSVCRRFHEMPENTIKERTFCCGSGAGLGTDENFEMRMRGGFPRANAVKHVRDRFGVNLVACVCAIDKATLPPLLEYWVPGMNVAGVHELLGNALVVEGENERS